jgi:hypothetical protein
VEWGWDLKKKNQIESNIAPHKNFVSLYYVWVCDLKYINCYELCSYKFKSTKGWKFLGFKEFSLGVKRLTSCDMGGNSSSPGLW